MGPLNIAVVGATGAVGRQCLQILEQRAFPTNKVKLLASKRSAGTSLQLYGEDIIVEEARNDSFDGVDIAFISVSADLSAALAPVAVKSGAVVIDDSSFFRMRPEVPLVVPEVNGEDVEWHQGIISNPNCSTIPLALVLNPLNKINRIQRIVADTYQSVSGAGASAMISLSDQAQDILDEKTPVLSLPTDQIAFNLIPRIDNFLPNGYTKEEQKVVDETRKIMHCKELAISATCVRVPVFIAHSAALHVEFENEIAVDATRELLAAQSGIKILDNPDEGVYPMPWDVAGSDDVFVGRIRSDASHPKGIAMWVVSDNLRKGAALNAIQIAEEMLRRGCL